MNNNREEFEKFLLENRKTLENSKYEFEVILPDPMTTLDEYYIFRGQAISKETFEQKSFINEMMGANSYIHVVKLTPEEIIERYFYAFTPEQIEVIKNQK